MRWQAITPAGITIHHRTYDHDLLAPYRGQPSPVAGRGGKWEIHYNPHDVRQIWIRLTDGELTEIPWIHRDHVHQPFNDHTWQHIRTHAVHGNHDDSQQHEAHLADALDQLMRRVHTGHATTTERALLARATTPPVPAARHPHHTGPTTDEPAQHSDHDAQGADSESDSIDDLDNAPYDDLSPNPATGFGLYDAYEEADKW
ncbi:Mu transposase C-terminal domain-containing protein [Streptomyces sp. NPDC004009]